MGRRSAAAGRSDHLYYRYGITLKQYHDLATAQGNACMLCRHIPDVNSPHPSRRYLCVDHDHRTGEVRGLLCHRCNVGLGNFKDDIEVLTRAIAYLEGELRQENHPR